ncbi:MAG: glycosyltransferase family 39 protein [Blastocatellia bacterium]
MSKRLLAVLFAVALVAFSVYLGNLVVGSPEIGLTILTGIVPAVICYWIIIKDKSDRQFLMRLFSAALIVRWAVAFFIASRDWQLFFGGDSDTFDIVGNALSHAWQGLGKLDTIYMQSYIGQSRPGWGMFYYVGSVYYVIGQNQLAVQLINCALGAAACIAVYRIAMLVYPNQRVARVAAVLTAFSPSMILWSSQMLKDGPIVLCLCLCTLYTLKLRDGFKVKHLLCLLSSLFCLYSLRNYAFYIMFVAVAGAFVFAGKRFTPLRVLQGGLLVIMIGIALAYFGAANPQETFDLKRLQYVRVWSAKEANSGFGGDVDITDPAAAIEFLPIGLLYVLFAPFPWMINNLRQFITLPELLIWWLMVPMMVKGYWFAIKRRLKESFAICIFTVGLTLSYALYQTNVGTAYRHRAQLYVFFIIFISIGWELRREARQRKHAQIAFTQASFSPLRAESGSN